MKFKLLFISLILTVTQCYCAEDLQDLTTPKPPAYRMGLTDEAEVKFSTFDNKIYPNVSTINKNIDYSIDKIENETDELGDLSKLTYADLSIKRLSTEISKTLEADDRTMLGDLSMLWQGAAMQSDTINYALYKLSNPEEDKPDTHSIKNVLGSIANASSIVGATVGNPMIAAGSFLGGNLLSIFSQDTKALNYKYTKINDADMVILVRKIEELQQKTVNLYYDYMVSRKKVLLLQKMVKERKQNYDLSLQSSREIALISDAYYRNAMDKLSKANAEFYTNRASLEQFVGHDIFEQFEKEVTEREKSYE